MPRFSSVQTKFIRTTEFWLVAVFNLAMLIVPLATSPAVMSATSAAKYVAIVDAVAVGARQLAKGVAAWQSPLLATSTAPSTAGVVAVAKIEPADPLALARP